MKKGIAFIALVAVVILIISARVFETGTLLFVALTMLIVAFFAASTVLLGVLSRRAGAAPKNHDEHETIRDADHS